MQFKAKTRLDKVFEVSILLKALDGILEILGGLVLLVIKPDTISDLAIRLTQGELSHDPNDFIATHILHTAQGVTGSALIFGALYLMSHGIVKVVLVREILYNRLWAYPGLIIVTAGFMVYQLYELTLSLSFWLIILTIFDAFVIYLTAREYANRRQARPVEEA